ncbi:glycosyltransferase [Actinoplanes sp. LDG1-06]|uniref:Glycosyltransferase n=1 Tax=Paractinoplanes ovalisporus TaxID=2810368 RepID=A0ABS2AMQ6_9ACTN|nr:glycosyltransferase [Actinoplanes ovalisporus]MBM2621137.1 glycosyltransferase [Actinoplanes ovalisporus]
MWFDKLASRRVFFICTVIAGAFFLGLIAATWHFRGRIDHPALLTFWWISNGAVIYSLYPLARNRRRAGSGSVTGRVVAVVSVHEQNESDLRACIWSILNQSRVVVDEVHVVDDGSTHAPVQPFAHPRVRWHRTEHGGARAAQRYVLDRLDPEDWDFVMAVDGNCVLDEHAVECQLREFAQPNVVATTAMVVMRNGGHNMLTRLVDLNTGTGVMRPTRRSALRAVQIGPGALSVYRARVLFEHERPVVDPAADGDDHCLARYPDLDGEVVPVPEAIVWTTAPTDFATVRRQLMRTAARRWRVLATTLAPEPPNRNRTRAIVLLRLLCGPAWVFCAVVLLVEAASGETSQAPWLILYGALYLLVRYAKAGHYLAVRPAMSRSEKLRTWILLTPVEAVCNLLGVGAIRFLALFPSRASGRPDGEPYGRSPLELPSAEGDTALPVGSTTVYYSGYMSEKTNS